MARGREVAALEQKEVVDSRLAWLIVTAACHIGCQWEEAKIY